MSGLSVEQEYAFQKVCRGENVFITGPGGSGKSFLVEKIVKYFTLKNKKYQVTSTTGCSSVLLANNIKMMDGNLNVKTIHSFAGIGLCKGDNDIIVNKVINNFYLTKRWRHTDILIIDEVSMMSCKMFNVIESIARNTRIGHKPFGNMQIILLGDFLQLPPIADINDPETAKFCFESDQWYNIIPRSNHVELKTIFRQKDETFRNILSEIRIGEISLKNIEILTSLVGREYDMEANHNIIPIQILSTRNEVAFVNQSFYNKIDSPEFKFKHTIKTNVKVFTDGKAIPEELLKKCKNLNEKSLEMEIINLQKNIPVEDSLSLKKGAPVMVIFNLDIENSICNGTLGIVCNFSKNGDIYTPIVRFSDGKERLIGCHTWQHSEYPTITLSQIPLTLAFASSIHKQQGSSISMARMNLGKSIFENSQIYVALSRMTSLDGLYLDSFDCTKITVNKKAKDFYDSFPKHNYEKITHNEEKSIQSFLKVKKIGPKSEPEIEFKSKPEIEFKSKPEIEFKSEPEIEFKSKPEIEFKSEPEIEFKSEYVIAPEIEKTKQIIMLSNKKYSLKSFF